MITHKSITTPDINHDDFNMLVEFIALNNNLLLAEYPWKLDSKTWGKNVSVLRKLSKPPYDIHIEQLACYIWLCKPKKLSSKEFAKIAVVAKRLIPYYKIEDVVLFYKNLIQNSQSSGFEQAKYKEVCTKNLLTFLEELES